MTTVIDPHEVELRSTLTSIACRTLKDERVREVDRENLERRLDLTARHLSWEHDNGNRYFVVGTHVAE